MQPELGAAETEEFMSVAAHDLRNPIAVVRASAQMAQRQINRGDTPGAQTRLKSIVDQTDRLTEMLETFLDAARLGAGQVPLRPERLDLREVVDSAAERARMLLGETIQRGIEAQRDRGFARRRELRGDAECRGSRVGRVARMRLSQVQVPHRERRFRSELVPVQVEALRVDDRVRVCVSGGGAGPYVEEVSRLFERFFRGRSAAEAGQSGSGLGLFTARGIARLHGGDVRRLDGDLFELELPLVADSPADP